MGFSFACPRFGDYTSPKLRKVPTPSVASLAVIHWPTTYTQYAPVASRKKAQVQICNFRNTRHCVLCILWNYTRPQAQAQRNSSGINHMIFFRSQHRDLRCPFLWVPKVLASHKRMAFQKEHLCKTSTNRVKLRLAKGLGEECANKKDPEEQCSVLEE